MKKAHEQVREFHQLVGASIGDVAKPDATVDMGLRLKLIAEEFDELLEALAPDGPTAKVAITVNQWLDDLELFRDDGYRDPPNLPEVADALADLEYVTVGSAVTWGIPGAEVFDAVHDANMRKAGGPKDPKTGKALKPPGWKPPDIEKVLAIAAGVAYEPHWAKQPGCKAARDGHCIWQKCPQLADNEPRRSGRHCPLDTRDDDE